MKKILVLSLGLLGLTLVPLRATTYVFENFNTTLLDGTAQPWTGMLEVELGAFINGFTPTNANRDLWLGNWVAETGGYYDASGPEWSAALNLADNATLSVGTQLYVWAFDLQSGASAQSALLVDGAWKTVSNSSLDLTTNFFGFSAGTSALVGAFDFNAQTARTATASAVPEPGTSALLAGLAVLGLVACRRGRRVSRTQ